MSMLPMDWVLCLSTAENIWEPDLLVDFLGKSDAPTNPWLQEPIFFLNFPLLPEHFPPTLLANRSSPGLTG